MNVIRPVVGQWYRGGTNELFEVVAIDDQDQTIEIQYFDGTVTEVDFDSWNEQLLDELIDAADAPEDWSGAVDVEAEDLDREFEDIAGTQFIQRSAQYQQQDQPRHRAQAGDDEEIRPSDHRHYRPRDRSRHISRQDRGRRQECVLGR